MSGCPRASGEVQRFPDRHLREVDILFSGIYKGQSVVQSETEAERRTHPCVVQLLGWGTPTDRFTSKVPVHLLKADALVVDVRIFVHIEPMSFACDGLEEG